MAMMLRPRPRAGAHLIARCPSAGPVGRYSSIQTEVAFMVARFLCAALLLISCPAFAAAHSRIGMPADRIALPAADTTQIFLGLAERLEHPDARATIIRPVGAEAPDMILVTSATTPADLQQALQMLLYSRHSFGLTLDRELRAHVPAAAAPNGGSDALREAAANLLQLEGAPEIEVPGFGMVRSVFIKVVDLPPAGGAPGH